MARKKRKGRSLKRNHPVASEEGPEVVQAPHSFVIHRGLACPYIQDLTKDLRRLMEPFTAINLKERKSNKLKDFIALSSHFHVTHMCIFNKATTQLSLKVVRLPRGPTLTYKVHQFTLARDIIASSRKQFVEEDSFHHAPLVILNNFAGEGKHLKLMATTFQNMFPTINLATVNLATIKRCILLSYNPATKLVEMRHYSLIATPMGLSRGVKKVVLGKVPNLSKCEDIADLFNSGNISESEFEDDDANQVILPQDLKRKGNLENNKSSIRLYEIGPRTTLELMKIEDGLLTGEVLHHDSIVKTEEEIEAIRRQREKKKKLKEYRKQVQNENKAKNEKLREKKVPDDYTQNPKDAVDNDPDDDVEYYRQEIGEEPDKELFEHAMTNERRRFQMPKYMAKRRKYNSNPRGRGDDSTRRRFDKNPRDRDGDSTRRRFDKNSNDRSGESKRRRFDNADDRGDDSKRRRIDKKPWERDGESNDRGFKNKFSDRRDKPMGSKFTFKTKGNIKRNSTHSSRGRRKQ